MANFLIEKKIGGNVIGLDEVGRGPLAGPVISCGCLFKEFKLPRNNFKITDSKKLSSKKRKELFNYFLELKKIDQIEYHLGIATVKEIDDLNILQATKLSMKRAINKFKLKDATIIIDGNFGLDYNKYKQHSFIKGDQLSISIAAASIIAKIHRDRLMTILSKNHKDFGWDKNAGYGTKMHIENIYRLGPTIHHRKTFEPIKSLIHS